MRTCVLYESPEYEDDTAPGTYAAIMIVEDDDGLHVMLGQGDAVIADLPIPACEAFMLADVFRTYARRAIREGERVIDQPDDHQHIEQHAGPLESGGMPYGPRQVGSAGQREVRGEPYTRSDHTREMPTSHPSSLMAAGARPVRAVPAWRRTRRAG